MTEILILESLGFTFSINGDSLHYLYKGEHLEPMVVRLLLASLREKKEEAIQFLKKRHHLQSLPLPVVVSIEESPAFLAKQDLRIAGFEWPKGGDATLFVEPADGNIKAPDNKSGVVKKCSTHGMGK